MPITVLQTDHLTKRYGALVAVNDLSLKVYEGEILGFLGPNGAGKTISINLMCGLLKPDSGRGFALPDLLPPTHAVVALNKIFTLGVWLFQRTQMKARS